MMLKNLNLMKVLKECFMGKAVQECDGNSGDQKEEIQYPVEGSLTSV